MLLLFTAKNVHLISWDLMWLLKHCCLLQFILPCNKRLRIFNAKLRLCADKPDMTVKWAFPEPRQPCGDLNKTKRRPRNKQDNYGLGCRAPVCLPSCCFYSTNTEPEKVASCRRAAPPSRSTEPSVADIKTVTDENESSIPAHLKKWDNRRLWVM